MSLAGVLQAHEKSVTDRPTVRILQQIWICLLGLYDNVSYSMECSTIKHACFTTSSTDLRSWDLILFRISRCFLASVWTSFCMIKDDNSDSDMSTGLVHLPETSCTSVQTNSVPAVANSPPATQRLQLSRPASEFPRIRWATK